MKKITLRCGAEELVISPELAMYVRALLNSYTSRLLKVPIDLTSFKGSFDTCIDDYGDVSGIDMSALNSDKHALWNILDDALNGFRLKKVPRIEVAGHKAKFTKNTMQVGCRMFTREDLQKYLAAMDEASDDE